MDEPSAVLMARWCDGDQQAAQAIFRRYAHRLRALAQRRLSGRLGRHLDADDIVQSAYQSFFAGARAGRYALRRRGDLWRHIGRERSFGSSSSLAKLPARLPGAGPSPSQAAQLSETRERILRGLRPAQRRIVELRLDGFEIDEIASQVKRSERTVRRVLDGVKDRLQLGK
jgi:DNA-directed RNA polymerase specialized sigma24 family protein